MLVEIPELVEERRPLELGDIIVYKDNNVPYLVTKVSYEEVAVRSFDGTGGMMGKHTNLKVLNEEFVKRRLADRTRIYRASEYKLQLVRKEK